MSAVSSIVPFLPVSLLIDRSTPNRRRRAISEERCLQTTVSQVGLGLLEKARQHPPTPNVLLGRLPTNHSLFFRSFLFPPCITPDNFQRSGDLPPFHQLLRISRLFPWQETHLPMVTSPTTKPATSVTSTAPSVVGSGPVTTIPRAPPPTSPPNPDASLSEPHLRRVCPKRTSGTVTRTALPLPSQPRAARLAANSRSPSRKSSIKTTTDQHQQQRLKTPLLLSLLPLASSPTTTQPAALLPLDPTKSTSTAAPTQTTASPLASLSSSIPSSPSPICLSSLDLTRMRRRSTLAPCISNPRHPTPRTVPTTTPTFPVLTSAAVITWFSQASYVF